MSIFGISIVTIECGFMGVLSMSSPFMSGAEEENKSNVRTCVGRVCLIIV